MQLLRKPASVPLLVVACGALLLAAALLGGGPQGVLGVLPAILLLLGPALGLYPGEETILRLAAARRRRRSPRAHQAAVATAAWCGADLSCRILLLAAGTPRRGPPALLLARP